MRGELRVGDSIIERIATAIAEVQFVVAVVSVNSVESRWCQKELSLAITGGLYREGVKVLPLRLGDVLMPATLVDTLYLQVDPEDPAAVADRLGMSTRTGPQEGFSGPRSEQRCLDPATHIARRKAMAGDKSTGCCPTLLSVGRGLPT